MSMFFERLYQLPSGLFSVLLFQIQNGKLRAFSRARQVRVSLKLLRPTERI
jgi:hypothetical protein